MSKSASLLLLSEDASVAAGGIRRGLMLGRSALRADSTAMLRAGSRRAARCANCVRSAQTCAASQITKRAARADPAPALLVAPQIAPAGCRLPRGHRRGVRREHLPGNGVLTISTTRKPEAARRLRFLISAQRRREPGREPMQRPQRCTLGSPQRALRGAEERRPRGRARSALRDQTRRGCSSAVSAANVASSATGHVGEYRRGVGAQRRPPR